MSALYYLLHPNQLRSIVQWKLWHEPVHKRDTSKECDTLRICFEYLNKTSRSFSVVIQELHPELQVPVCLFYLVLRGLDTIEDDTTIPVPVKVPLMREFHTHIDESGWTYTDISLEEKDRDLLVNFHYVITEMKKIHRPYFDIIRDITIKMENGMADFLDASNVTPAIQTVDDYERYCHFAAGVVGEGLTAIFVESKLANPRLLERPHLSESMGQFLQQINIIRDVWQDNNDRRRWYPREVWSKYVNEWNDLFEPANRELAMQCVSEMVLIALRKVEDCLHYMAGIRDQSVFNFVAIPQAMAVATLECVFRNPAVFHSTVKITKGDACQIMWESTQNLLVLSEVFRRYTRRIHTRNDPRDPNYLAISIQCAKIEQYIETLYPGQNPEKPTVKPLSADSGEGGLMTSVVFLTFMILSLSMIGVAWLSGVKFDSVWSTSTDYLSKYEHLLMWPMTTTTTTAVADVTATAAHSEL